MRLLVTSSESRWSCDIPHAVPPKKKIKYLETESVELMAKEEPMDLVSELIESPGQHGEGEGLSEEEEGKSSIVYALITV